MTIYEVEVFWNTGVNVVKCKWWWWWWNCLFYRALKN